MVTEDLSAYLEVSLYSKGASRVSEVEVKRGSSTCSAGGYEHVTNFVTDDDAVQVRLPMIHVVDMRDGSRKSQRFKSLQRKSIRTMNDTIRRQRQAKRALAHRCLGKRDCGVMTATKRSEHHAITTSCNHNCKEICCRDLTCAPLGTSQRRKSTRIRCNHRLLPGE